MHLMGYIDTLLDVKLGISLYQSQLYIPEYRIE